MDEVSVDFIDGFMRGISCGCDDLNYVVFYGAKEFSHSEETIKESLRLHFGVTKKPQYPFHRLKIDNFILLETSEWKGKLDSVLVKWVDSKSKYDNEFIESYKEDLLYQVHEFAGTSPKCFYANIEHESFEYENETIGFVGDNKAFYLHFSWSD